MDFGKGGNWAHIVCLNGCGTEWDEFVPAGRGSVHLCDECMAKLVDEFWAAYEAEGGDAAWRALQAEIVAEYERGKRA